MLHYRYSCAPANFCSFMESIKWVDTTYVQKHKSEDPSTLRAMYYPNLAKYSTKNSAGVSKPVPQAVMLFIQRYGRKVGMFFGVYLLSLLPVVGRFVMPAVSFYTFRQNVGTTPAAVIFGTGLVLPKRVLVTFLHTYFASRSLMRELVSTSMPTSSPRNSRSDNHSLSRISAAFHLPRNRNVDGSSTDKVYCSGLPLHSPLS